MVRRRAAVWSWIGLLGVVGGVVLYAAGVFSGERIAAGDSGSARQMETPQRTARAERRSIAVFEDAVGTVNSRRTVAVAAQLAASVLRVDVKAGERVRAGQVIVALDDRDLAARVAQARQALLAADAAVARATQIKVQADARATQAGSSRERTAKLLAEKAATVEQMEVAEANHLAATAAVAEADAAVAAAAAERERAQAAIHEAEVALGFTTIRAPIDGVVAERSIEAGDLAWPGRTLLVVLDPEALRLEARVRESLIDRSKVGDELEIAFDALDRRAHARVAEILPAVDPRSRTFELRAEFEAVEGVRPGMFARLRIPVGTRDVVTIPAGAIVRVGQLRSALVDDGGGWRRRLITVGASLDGGEVEVLSGLVGSERVGLADEERR